MTFEEQLQDANNRSAADLDQLLELMAAIPDNTSEEVREIYRKLKGQSFETVATSLHLLMETHSLSDLAQEYTKKVITFTELATFTNKVARMMMERRA